eukprot:360913-Chlamydomonas_euryale.AAC.8
MHPCETCGVMGCELNELNTASVLVQTRSFKDETVSVDLHVNNQPAQVCARCLITLSLRTLLCGVLEPLHAVAFARTSVLDTSFDGVRQQNPPMLTDILAGCLAGVSMLCRCTEYGDENTNEEGEALSTVTFNVTVSKGDKCLVFECESDGAT